MASTLIVQNLQGPASGANANKIIVSSGNTFVPSVGQVVNVQRYSTSTQVDHSSGSYTNVWAVYYTPILTNSKIIFSHNVSLMSYRSNGAGARINTAININGATVQYDDNTHVYDYGGNGVWVKAMHSNTTEYSNTSGSQVSWGYFTSCADANEVKFNEGLSSSSLIVTEVAQ